MGAELDRILDEVRRELALRFSNPDDPGLYERRKRLRALFRRVPVADTRALHARLGERPTGDALSKSFHGRLSTPTRRELLKILADRFPPVLKEPPEPEPVVVFPSNPLPVAAEERFRAAVVALRDKVRLTWDPRAHRYRCWLAKLEGGGDDRVIQWHRICLHGWRDRVRLFLQCSGAQNRLRMKIGERKNTMSLSSFISSGPGDRDRAGLGLGRSNGTHLLGSFAWMPPTR